MSKSAQSNFDVGFVD